MGSSSKSSCFSLLSTTAFIVFALLFVSSLSPLVAEEETSLVKEIHDVGDIDFYLDKLADKDLMGLLLFNHTVYHNGTYDALSVKYYDAGVRFYAIEVEMCDEDCQEEYELKMNDLPNVLFYEGVDLLYIMSGSEWSADRIRHYICDTREDACNGDKDDA